MLLAVFCLFVLIATWHAGYCLLLHLIHQQEMATDYPDGILPYEDRWRLSMHSVCVTYEFSYAGVWLLFMLWPIWLLFAVAFGQFRIWKKRRYVVERATHKPSFYVWPEGSPFRPTKNGGNNFRIGCFSGTYQEALAAIETRYSGRMREYYIIMLNSIARYQNAKQFSKKGGQWLLELPSMSAVKRHVIHNLMNDDAANQHFNSLSHLFYSLLMQNRAVITQVEATLLQIMWDEAQEQELRPLFVGKYSRL